MIAVDLSTGDRTKVSGQYEVPANGKVVTGAGPELGFVRDVGLARDGTIVALDSPNSADKAEIVRVDPSTGDREYVWRQGDAMRRSLSRRRGRACAPR